MDTSNKYLVGVAGDGRLHLQMPPRGPMTKDEALLLAAWMVALADPGGERFEKILAAVLDT